MTRHLSGRPAGHRVRHPAGAQCQLDQVGKERLVVSDPGDRRRRREDRDRCIGRRGDAGGEVPDILDPHVGVDLEPVAATGGIDQPGQDVPVTSAGGHG
ncbi:MAG: hypothetical protein MK365_16020 [Vicinamibacterales bacterium]|nr:hypothetical protein [Vicinamibacterales bacterium]